MPPSPPTTPTRRALSLPRPLAQGALEGKITANRIYQSAMNGGLGPAMEPSPSMTAFSKVNDEWIASMTSLSAQSTAADKAYWHHVNLINLQMRGLWEGYSAAAKASKGALPALKWESILYMNLGDELGDFAGFVRRRYRTWRPRFVALSAPLTLGSITIADADVLRKVLRRHS